MRLTDAIEEFLTAQRADGSSPKTVKWYRSVLNSFSQGCDVPLDALKSSNMREYIVFMRENHERYANATQKPKQGGRMSRASVDSHVTALLACVEGRPCSLLKSNPYAGAVARVVAALG